MFPHMTACLQAGIQYHSNRYTQQRLQGPNQPVIRVFSRLGVCACLPLSKHTQGMSIRTILLQQALHISSDMLHPHVFPSRHCGLLLRCLVVHSLLHHGGHPPADLIRERRSLYTVSQCARLGCPEGNEFLVVHPLLHRVGHPPADFIRERRFPHTCSQMATDVQRQACPHVRGRTR